MGNFVMDEDIKNAIDKFIEVFTKQSHEYHKVNFPNLPLPSYSYEQTSENWVKIWEIEKNSSNVNVATNMRIVVFIALRDFKTATLGHVWRGDIHKPASYKAPAKHARGNILKTDYADWLIPYSVKSLK